MFKRVGAEMANGFTALGSKMRELELAERLGIIAGFFSGQKSDDPELGTLNFMTKGNDVCDLIAPLYSTVQTLLLGPATRWCRVLFLKGYPAYLRQSLISELTSTPGIQLALSIDFLFVPTDEAATAVERQLLAVDSAAPDSLK